MKRLIRPFAGLDQADHFSGLGVPSELLFREDQHPVDCDFEHPATRRDQLDLRRRVGSLELSRQPGGSGLVVSLNAILDRNLHEDLLESLGVSRTVC
jgi:hypothetical protein